MTILQLTDHMKHRLFDKMFKELVEYKRKYEHFVFLTGQASPELVKWARKQRKSRRKGTMSDDRIRKLDSIGFSWTAAFFDAGVFSTASG